MLHGACITFIAFSVAFVSNLCGYSINPGPTGIFFQNENLVMDNGITVSPGAVASLKIPTKLAGCIDLRETGQLVLYDNLALDAHISLSSGGSINGMGNTISLYSNVVVPPHAKIKFTGDTIIQGNGHTLDMSDYAQLAVDLNVSITLKNIILKSHHNTMLNPLLSVPGDQCYITFDDVIFAPVEDVVFRKGQLFFLNDVIFTGTSGFVYELSQPSVINSKSTLYFDMGTTFSYAPTVNNNHLLLFQDSTSKLHLNGCSLQTTPTGLKLSNGTLICENQVEMVTHMPWDVSGINATPSVSLDWSTYTSANITSLEFNPLGNYIVACGRVASNVSGSALRTYQYTGSSFVKKYEELSTYTTAKFNKVAWSPNGLYVAVAQQGAANGLKVYNFNSGTGMLSGAQIRTGYSNANAVAWSADSKYIAVGDASVIDVYEMTNGVLSLSYIARVTVGTLVHALSWRPVDGYYLAAVGENALGLCVYEFTNNTISPVTVSEILGCTIMSVDWMENGKYLTIGTFGIAIDGKELRTYEFKNNDTLELVVASDITESGGSINIVRYGKGEKNNYIISGSYLPLTGTNNVQIHQFVDDQHIFVDSLDSLVTSVNAIAWSPQSASFIHAGTASAYEISMHALSSQKYAYTQSNGIIFGDYGAGQALDIILLHDARVMVKGSVVYDL
ncbi:MAG: hypothetical protein A2Y40_01790 [Candidatus Margulisbacteria bacterium GWF2_35_9]|nr:MAG: hypothetical protein A2Y40_01790 [Candidatus Margulisbacteria bacterium GWF2_35_9]